MKSAFRKLSLLIATSGLLATSGILAGSLANQVDDFVDPVQYAKEPVKYQHVQRAEDGDDEPVAADVNKVTLHYHNDDGANASRTFYLWSSTADGKEYDGTVTNNGKDMYLEVDFTKDKFAELRNKFDIRLIIKYKGTWTGQSDDTIIKWEDFPPTDGVTEVWMVPGIGSALECYKTEEETKSDKVTNTYFSSFKKIHVQATAIPNKIRIYSYDARYLAMGVGAQAKNKETRLFKTLDAPSNPKKSGSGDNTRYDFDITLNNTAHINIQYVLETEYPAYEGKVHSIVIPMHKFYSYDGAADTKTNITRFDKYYTYDKSDLGVTYTAEKSTFKVWAPTAGLVKLNIYKYGTSVADDAKDGKDMKDNTYNMVFMQGGVWACELEGDMNGYYYTYTVYNSLGKNEVVDPYAKACGANGKRGMILDFSKTNPTGWENIDGKWDGKAGYDITTPQQLAIYEAHVRDLTMHSSWTGKEKPGTYLAFGEKGTRLAGHSEIKTGFDHLDELGVNAIQFTPVYDHDNTEYVRKEVVDKNGEPVKDSEGNIQYEEDWGTYNWGYNPLNYNCVEGQYSSNPNDGSVRVKEFKQLIYNLATNSNHTRTIMDVVYNHVSSGPNSNFTKLMPRYYFRYTDNNDHWNKKYGKKKGDKDYIEPDGYFNGSGCSNEVKTEAKMMRKFIIESLCWWAEEYNVKGFRFDLMGLIDVETLKQASVKLKAIDPDIYMYGEGWSAEGCHVDESLYKESKGDYKATWGADTYCIYRDLHQSATKGVYIGGFNDEGRNAIRGGNDRGAWGDDDKPVSVREENRRPGSGFINSSSSSVGNYSDTVGQMMIGNNSGKPDWNNEGSESSPKWVQIKFEDSAIQTVNYASCHDNYSLFDQISGSKDFPKTDAFAICRAVTSVNAAIMLSNGVAFMQGGEELYRTKVVSDSDATKLQLRMPEDYVRFYHNDTKINNIAHNAYKCSDETNAFDYTRKLEVSYLGSKCTCTKLYFDRLAQIIKLRTSLSYKSTHTTAGDPSYWSTGGGSTCVSYFIGEKTSANSGYALLLSGDYASNYQDLTVSNTYTEYANIGEGTITGAHVASTECYSALVTKQN